MMPVAHLYPSPYWRGTDHGVMWPCEWCGYAFDTKNQLWEHMRSHDWVNVIVDLGVEVPTDHAGIQEWAEAQLRDHAREWKGT
jgi:hypothetical protein